ncbi:uncharacterized protein LOC117111249 [Anneissia japonica]|uniref:uncharacterized protein LOC117111249 n=1 Tax=Anneissia japonica TaxID=1529436 RepID=UPI0014255480|nr:uncharacterized protein LOC117111249 [Anneissia japonica]XP_033110049.1 uncharacterized protein LOC117111249 [Anneissia japonica]XP_033110050.1 uncharacterized protein LOC117111249 [Anneissia japonica]XP_033110051.1 uncharacterized protein LOC117111249 [Anneissia japonica]
MPKKKPVDQNCVRRQSSRKIRAPQKFEATPIKKEQGYNYWNLTQKQSLLKVLTQFSEQQVQPKTLTQTHYNTLRKSIKTKSVDSIKDYIKYLAQSIPSTEEKDADDGAPIQEWVELAEDLAEATSLDCSSDISKMLSTASKDDHGVFFTNPDFKSLYQFLDALFHGKNLPDLTSIDSLVILDCMDKLACFLDDVDTTEQKDYIINQCEKIRTFLYSEKDFNVTTEMCEDITDEDDNSEEVSHLEQNNQSQRSLQHDQPVASCSRSDTNSVKNAKNRITLSMSSLNPFGVPTDKVNFQKDDVTDV